MKTLLELYNKHYDQRTGWPDKGTVHSYIEVYEELLAPYRKTAHNILEIGLMSGESLRMWDEYFKGEVFGIDCSIKPIDGKADLTKAIEDGLYISIGDATNPWDIERYYKGLKFDVIIDDGSHNIEDQLKSFHILKRYLAFGGIYIIEDIQDIDNERYQFESFGIEVIDRRKIKGRYDDVLIIIK
jgi:cephalosporin hydroxylase